MFELIKAGGWSMWPIILCSVAALAIIGGLMWAINRPRPARVAAEEANG